MSQRHPFRARPGRLPGVAVAGAVVVLVVATLAVALRHDAVTPVFGVIAVDIANVVASISAGLACGWAARRNSGRLRNAWRLLCLTAALWSAGNLVWLYLRLQRDTIPLPSLADACCLAAIVTAAIGLLSFPTGPNTRAGRTNIVLDTLVVASSVWFISDLYVLPRVFHIVDDTELYDLVILAYPMGAIVVLTLAIMLFVRAPAGKRLHLGMLALAFVASAIAGSVYAHAGATDEGVTTSLVSPGWLGGSLMVALAALAPAATARDDATRETADGSSVIGAVLVYGTFLTAVISAAIHPAIHSPRDVISGLVVLVVFGVRQTLLAADNQALRHELEIDNKALRQDLQSKVDELDRLAQRYERILDGVAEGIYGVDIDGRVNFVNPTAAGVLGYPAEELRGQPAHECFHHTRTETGEGSADRCHLADALEGAETVRRSDQYYVRRDGSTFPVEVIASPIRTAGTVTGAVVAFSDIT
ncbi:MAG TPA: PAS domain S-box protein, partial [Pseudonocardiaceae bacterium]